jgi:DMSO/TMAO reductase YedYZ molybdopterin-dependent catalytic subunit
MSLSRRQVLGRIAATGATTLIDPGAVLARLVANQPCAGQGAGTLLGTLPLFRSGAPAQPFGVKLGGPGLDARLVTDLSTLEPDRLITPTALAFIRTESPAAAAHHNPWTIRASGLIADPGALMFDDLTDRARSMGPHLLECSGNNNPANFGLMSVCEWDGVLLSNVISRFRPSAAATSVLVGGMDHEGQRSADSIGGASWVFPLASLDRLGPFLAVRMNGEALSADHGAPVRLVVPGWYGCSWIKWVNEVRLTAADEPATSQMKEFAGRTHQAGRHDFARDYTSADIQTAATPIRVEKRRGPTGIEYRIVGIVWGGDRPVVRLAIRFRAEDTWTPFSICPGPNTHRMWSLWEYRWKPAAAGVYDIALRVPDPAVPQRRLETGYYMRQVKVEDV